MGLFCFLRDSQLSRFVDGELPLAEYRRLQEHVRACVRCHRRAAEFRAVDAALVSFDEELPRPPASLRLVIAVAVAAALVGSLAANLFLLQLERPREAGVLTVDEPPSETLSSFYTRLADSGGQR